MSDNNMGFKQFLQLSKEQLYEAAKQTPRGITEYTVRKYVKIPVGDKQNKQFINLKPKHKIIIEWLYENKQSPIVQGIRFKDVDGVDCLQTFKAFWNDEKMHKWLKNNSKANQ